MPWPVPSWQRTVQTEVNVFERLARYEGRYFANLTAPAVWLELGLSLWAR